MTNFETYLRVRRGRVAADSGPNIRLTTKTSNGGGTLRVSRSALMLLGINAKHGDHFYFIVEVDREAGAIRLTPTEDSFTGRQMNPMNREITLSRAFFEWTKWGDCRWDVEVQDGGLYGDAMQTVGEVSHV